MSSQALRAEKAHTPWTIEETASWPWEIRVRDAANHIVLNEARYAYSSSHKTVSDVMDAVGFDETDRDDAIRGNAEQVAKFRRIVLAVNCHDELLDEAGKVVAFLESTGMTTKFLDGLRAAIAKATGAAS